MFPKQSVEQVVGVGQSLPAVSKLKLIVKLGVRGVEVFAEMPVSRLVRHVMLSNNLGVPKDPAGRQELVLVAARAH